MPYSFKPTEMGRDAQCWPSTAAWKDWERQAGSKGPGVGVGAGLGKLADSGGGLANWGRRGASTTQLPPKSEGGRGSKVTYV